MFNLLCYASLISPAIKKIPYLKIPLLAVACIPLTIYQAASANIDSMIFGLWILTVTYFIHMVKSPVENKETTNTPLKMINGVFNFYGRNTSTKHHNYH